MKYKVCFPAMGDFKPVVVEADTRYMAAKRAAGKKGLLNGGTPMIYLLAAASVEKVERKKVGRKGWVPGED